jgi:predicted aspartyl protease
MTSPIDRGLNQKIGLAVGNTGWKRYVFAALVFLASTGLLIFLLPLTKDAASQREILTLTAAMEAFERGDAELAKASIQALAERGDASAQFTLGKMYQRGQGVSRSVADAIKWYEKAVRQREPSAMINLGLMYRLGDGVPKNFPEAVHLFRLATRYGDHLGSVYLGIMHEKGEGLFRSDETAVQYFQTAARRGEVLGMYHLARMHEEGRGTLPNMNAALDLYKQAAEKGHDPSLRIIQAFGVTSSSGASTPAAAAQLTRRTEIPIRYDGSRYFVDGKVVGVEEVSFVLDTGATLVSIPRPALDRLLSQGKIKESDFRGRIAFTGWDGGVTYRETLTLPSLHVGEEIVENISAAEARNQDTALLGVSFLSKFRNWSIDHERRLLILNDRP